MTAAGIPLLDLRRQFAAIRHEVEAAVAGVFESQRFILGEQGAALERECAALLGTTDAVGVASGTDALLLSYRALGLEPGAEVLTSPFSFFASAGAVVNAGCRPVFADIEPVSFNIDAAAAAAAVSVRTRALCVVHLFGQMADMAPLVALADRASAFLVEDACQSIGACYGEQGAGSLGVTGAFSFFPTKNLGGAGDGGLITTPDEKLAARLRSLRHHGQEGAYEHPEVGINSRLDEIQAAILRVKLKHLEAWSEGRRRNAAALSTGFLSSGLEVREDGLLDGADIALPVEVASRYHVYNQYTLRARDRDALREHLMRQGIGCAVYYPLPLHLQPCFAFLGYQKGQFPQAERACGEVISLPVFPELAAAEIDRVVAAVASFYRR